MTDFPELPAHMAGQTRNSEFEGSIPNWSHSRLMTFLKCPYRVLLQSRGNRETTHPAAARGTQIHTMAEEYVNGTLTKLPSELKKFTENFEELRDLYAAGKIDLEEQWAFNVSWEPCNWDSDERWGRFMVDVLVHEDEKSIRVIDHKSGKSRFNEVSHSRQTITYGLGTLFRFPDVEYVTTELWYIDEGKIIDKSFTRAQIMQFLPEYTKRALSMTTCKMFKPKPGFDACRFCDFKEEICDYGIK